MKTEDLFKVRSAMADDAKGDENDDHRIGPSPDWKSFDKLKEKYLKELEEETAGIKSK